MTFCSCPDETTRLCWRTWILFSWLSRSAFRRSMNTRNTSSVWTKTAWCTPRSLWLNLAPTLCGRTSVCDCTALSPAGLTPGSSGRSPMHHDLNVTPTTESYNYLLILDRTESFLWRLSLFTFLSSFLVLVSTKRYKNNVPIDPLSNPGKYKLESRYNVHSMEINK